jgi:hypothetical protein
LLLVFAMAFCVLSGLSLFEEAQFRVVTAADRVLKPIASEPITSFRRSPRRHATGSDRRSLCSSRRKPLCHAVSQIRQSPEP